MSSKNEKRHGGERAATGEVLRALEAVNFCTKPHPRPGPGPAPSPSAALRERMTGADLPKGGACAECARRLTRPQAALVLAAVGGLGDPAEAVRAAVELRATQPMAWSAILTLDPTRLSLALERAGVDHFSPGEYQSAAEANEAAARAA